MIGRINRIRIKNFILYIIAIRMIAVLFYIPVSAAQEPEFRIDIDSLNLQTGISTNIIISLTNAQGAQIINIEGIENFDILSQSQSSYTSINGSVTEYREDLYYTVMPKTTGQFILRAHIQYDGQIYLTNALNVNISENAGNNNNETVQDLFIKTVVSHSEAYSGEKIILTYELYSRYSVDGYGFLENIAIDGVVSKDIPDNQLKAEYVYLNGERYAMYEAKRMIIDPIKPGVYIIPSYNFQVNVLTNNGGFFHSTTPMYLQTEAKELTVKPLPTNGKPDDFSGIVGELQISSRYSRNELNYGDSLILYINISGRCNLDVLKSNIVGEMTGFSVYETLKNTTEYLENSQYYVQKDFEAILVPEKNGVLEISPISISYFNPVTEKYEKAEIPGNSITVLGDMPQPGNNFVSQDAAGKPIIINQVKYTEVKNEYFTFQIKKEILYAIIIGFVILVILSVVLTRLIIKSKKQDSKLKITYRKLINSKDISEIYNLFGSMIKYCYNMSLKASSKSIVRDGIPDETLASKVVEIMDYMESDKVNEKNDYMYLKDKIKGVYRIIRK